MTKLILCFLCMFSLQLIGQTEEINSHHSLINESLMEQLKFEMKSSNYSERNVLLVYRPLDEINNTNKGITYISNINEVKINYLTSKEIKKLSRKGVNYLKVYPIKLDNKNTLSILVEMVYLKRKTQILVGSSTYYFKIPCNDGELKLHNKSQNMF